MEGISCDKIQIGLSGTGEGNSLQENYSLIENETRHVKIFRLPNPKCSPKKFIPVSVIVISALIIAALLIIITMLINENQQDQDTAILHNFQEVKSLKAKLLKYLFDISVINTISGVYLYPSGTKSDEGVQATYKITGLFPGIVATEMPSPSAANTTWNAFINEVITNWNNHSLVRIDWRGSQNPLISNYNFTENVYTNDAERRWNELINEEGHLNKFWKEQLDLIVPYLLQLQNLRIITIFDILTRMNHKEFIWRGRPGENGTMKLYKLTHDYLTKHHNLHSLIWTWSLDNDDISQLENFWPGSDYVDVASVYMEGKAELNVINAYQKLVEVVGDKPISMENMWTVPKIQLLNAQPRWAWFTANYRSFDMEYYNNINDMKSTFNSISVINKYQIQFFNDTN